ncbi:TPA: hypothetical protein ACS78B_003755 [Providencia alcalifaciens]
MMEWKGIPYSLDVVGLLNTAENITTVAVNKVPTIAITTSFSWETVISAFFAALIPSLIAWYALKQNYNLAKFQHELSSNEDLVRLFRVSVAEFVTNTNILVAAVRTANLHGFHGDSEHAAYIIKGLSQEEKAVDFELNKLLLLLGQSNEEIKFIEKLVGLNNTINSLKKRYPSDRPGIAQDASKIHTDLRCLMVNANEVIFAMKIRNKSGTET